MALALVFVVLMWNGRRYPAGHGFDFGAHRDYTRFLRTHWRMPGYEDSRAAYNPPLFYLVGASVMWANEELPGGPYTNSFKILKMLLAVVAFAVVLVTMRIAGWILGEEAQTPFLLFLCSAPSFYRASAMYIPEQFLSLLIWTGFLVALRSWKTRGAVGWRAAAGCALLLCAAAWTRPLGFAAVGAWGLASVYLVARDGARRRAWLKSAGVIFCVCTLGCLTLFAFNYHRLGKVVPILPKVLKMQDVPLYRRQPLSFYVGLEPGLLFSHPVRPVLGNRWMPVLYSDYWGDYWKYWTVDHEVEGLAEGFRVRMLAAQNILAVLPTLLILSGLAALGMGALRAGPGSPAAGFVPVGCLLLCGGLFFLYFIVGAPHDRTDNVKATYLCFLMPAAAMGGAHMLRCVLVRPGSRWFWLAPYCLLFWLWSFVFLCVYVHHR